MNAARCRNVVSVLAPRERREGRTLHLDWLEVGLARANVRTMTGRELQIAGQVRSEATHVVEMRGNIPLHPRYRIGVAGEQRRLEIVSVRPHDHRNIWQVADAKEVPYVEPWPHA